MCNGSEVGSYLRPTDFVYHSTLGLKVSKKEEGRRGARAGVVHAGGKREARAKLKVEGGGRGQLLGGAPLWGRGGAGR